MAKTSGARRLRVPVQSTDNKLEINKKPKNSSILTGSGSVTLSVP